MTLDSYLRREGRGALIKLAAAVKVTPSTVSKWRYGRQNPSLQQALDVQRETGNRVRVTDLVASDTKTPKQAG